MTGWTQDATLSVMTANGLPIYERTRILNSAIAASAHNGWSVESSTPTSATLTAGSQCNHLLHLVLTVFTCGTWGLVWFALWIQQNESRMNVVVDPWGRVSYSAQVLEG